MLFYILKSFFDFFKINKVRIYPSPPDSSISKSSPYLTPTSKKSVRKSIEKFKQYSEKRCYDGFIDQIPFDNPDTEKKPQSIRIRFVKYNPSTPLYP